MDHATLDVEEYDIPEFSQPKQNVIFLEKSLGYYSWIMIVILFGIMAYVAYVAYVDIGILFEQDQRLVDYAKYTLGNLDTDTKSRLYKY